MKNTPLIRLVLVAGSALLAVSPCKAATQPWTDGGVTWSAIDGTPTYYNPDVNEDGTLYDKEPLGPGTAPVWGVHGIDGDLSEATVIGNYLQITTDGPSVNGYVSNVGWDYDHLTFETRFRVDSIDSTAYASTVSFAAEGKGFTLAFTKTAILQFGTVLVGGLDLTQWTVLRVTITGGASPTLQLYLNGQPDAVYTSSDFYTYPTPGISFGDKANPAEGGVTQYDYLRWTNTGAFAPQPVPEPQSVALLVMGGLLGLGYQLRARRRRSGT